MNRASAPLLLLALGLAACGSEPAREDPVLPALRRALADPDRGVRYAAVEALGKAGASPPFLGPALADEAWCVRREAGWWLARAGGEALPVLEAALAEGSPESRATAARALGRLGVAGVPVLGRALEDPDLEVRCEALVAVRRLGPEHGAGLASAVEGRLFSTDPDEQAEAALAFVAIAPEAADAAVTVLAGALRETRHLDHYEAIDALLAGGEACRAALRAIELELPDHDSQRDRIRWSREAWEEKRRRERTPPPPSDLPAPPEDLPPRPASPAPDLEALIGDLADAERDVRIRAARALRDVESWSADLEAGLRHALTDQDWRVRRAAVVALAAHGAAADRIAPFLADPILPLSHAAAVGIARCGEAAARPVADQVATAHYGVLHYAPLVYGRLGERGEPAVAILTDLLVHPDVNVRECAARCLRAIGAPARPAIPALLGALEDDRLCVVSHAALALGAIGDAGALLPALSHESARVRAYGTFAIGWVLGAERGVDQVPFEVRLPVERVAPPAGYVAEGLWASDFPTAFAAAKKRTYTDLDPIEAERQVELLLPEGQRAGCGVDFEEFRSTLASSELPAFVRYVTRARRTKGRRLYIYSPIHRLARWDHIPALLWFRRNEAPDVLSGFFEIEMPLSYTDAFGRQRVRDRVGFDPGPGEGSILRAAIRYYLAHPETGFFLPERWLLNRFEPDDEDAPLLLALARALEEEDEAQGPLRPRFAVLRALGGLRDRASEDYLSSVAAGPGDQALVALSALARRGDDVAAAELVERSDLSVGALFLLLEARPAWRPALLVDQLRDPDVAYALLDERSDWANRVTWLGVPWSEGYFLGVEPALAADPPPPDVLARIVVDVPLCNTKRLAAILFAAAEEHDVPPWWDEEEGDSMVGGVPYRTSSFLHAANPDRLLQLMRRWAESANEDVRDWARVGLILLGDAESTSMLVEWLRDAEVDFFASILARVDHAVMRRLLAEGSRNERFTDWDRRESLNALAHLLGWPRHLPEDVLEYLPEGGLEIVAAALRAGDIEAVLASSYWPRMLADLRAHLQVAPVSRRVALRALAGDATARAAIWSAYRAGRYRWVHHEIELDTHTLGGDPATLPHWCADLDSNCCRVSDGLAAYLFEDPYSVSDLWGSEKNGVGQPLSRRLLVDLALAGGRWLPAPLLDELSPPGRIRMFVPEPE